MSSCTTTPNGNVCLDQSNWTNCRPWELTEQSRTDCYADSLAQEALNIAGAQVNVFKLLGVHEQTLLVDLTGNGSAISGGAAQNHQASYAFDIFKTEWKSKQSGADAVLASAYIGYDFGVQKLANGRQKYGIAASVRQHITTIKIKQSSNAKSRVTKARVERSENGTEWYGVAVVTLPDNDQLNTVHFKHSVPNRYWRLRPLQFNGDSCDSWGVVAFEMYDYSVEHISNIQDKILMENRDRSYQDTAVTLKGYYDLVNVNTDLSRFGIEIPTANYQIRVNFNACVALLGRPVVVGDIVELPSETQYAPDLKPIKRYLEVTDVTWDASSYTPGWMPTMLLVTAQPAMATQETQDIFGDLSKNVDNSGLFGNSDGNSETYQDFTAVDQAIDQESKTLVPERGSEGSNVIREIASEDLGIVTVNIVSSNGSTAPYEDLDMDPPLLSEMLNTFRVRDDYTDIFAAGTKFNVRHSMGNDGSYVVLNSGSFYDNGHTIIPVGNVPVTHGPYGTLIAQLDISQSGYAHITKHTFNRVGLYVEDAIPQNGAPYTEGPVLPTTANNGDYHRLTYEGLAKDVPARLYRYSTTKSRWIFMESDKRAQYNNQKSVLDEYVTSPTRQFASEIK